VRADFRADGPGSIEEVEQAKVDVRELKSRGVTRYLDLNFSNKANIDDVHTDEEAIEDDDGGDIQEPPLQRPRLTFGAGDRSPGFLDDDWSPSIAPARPSPAQEPAVDEPTLLQPPADIPVPVSDDEPPLQPTDASTVDDILDETEPSREPSAAATVVNTPNAREAHGLPPAAPALDSITASYYEPSHAEDFASRRRRFNQQETMSLFGPARLRPPDRQDGPYSSTRPTTTPPSAAQPADAAVPVPPVNTEMDQLMDEALTVMDLDPAGLPEGWYVDEHGYFQTTSNPSDWWEVKSGCLIRHHVVPRRNLYVVRKDPKCPVDLECLDRIRVTMMKDAPGNYMTVTDCGMDVHQDYTQNAWAGVTIFQINGKTRKEMAMVVRQSYRSATQVANTLKSHPKKKVTNGASTLSAEYVPGGASSLSASQDQRAAVLLPEFRVGVFYSL